MIGSTVGSCLTFGGIDLAVGSDFEILGLGTLSGGHATFVIRPPFRGAVLDCYYVQAVASPSLGFVPLTPSASVILLNADLAANLPLGPAGLRDHQGRWELLDRQVPLDRSDHKALWAHRRH